MQNNNSRSPFWLFLLPTLLILLLSGILIYYNNTHAPAQYPVILSSSSLPELHAYPELADVIISINHASASELEQLPGIGPTRAADIVEYIKSNGPISSLDQLTAISGIGNATVEKIKPYLSVDP